MAHPQRIPVDGAELAFTVQGHGEPVVLIHGAFIADAFRPLLAEPSLVDHYRLIAYHRRGYADSSRTPGPTSMAQQAADCWMLLRHLGVARAHLVGHSLGASIALHLALDAPEVVHSLALLEPALFIGESAQSYREAQLRSVQCYREAGAAVAVDEALGTRWPGYRAGLNQVLPDAFDQAVAEAATVFESDIGALDWNFGPTEAARIQAPALVVLGGASPTLHPRFGETYRLLLEWLPNAEGFVLPGATHFLHLEGLSCRRDMAEALTAFFARHAMGAAL